MSTSSKNEITEVTAIVRARAFVAPTVARGCVFLPMHDESTNRLTDAVFDPVSRQPAYKACAVRVRAASPEEPRVGQAFQPDGAGMSGSKA